MGRDEAVDEAVGAYMGGRQLPAKRRAAFHHALRECGYAVVSLADLRELFDAVFGSKAGDEPNVYADYDRLCELSRKARAMLEAAK